MCGYLDMSDSSYSPFRSFPESSPGPHAQKTTPQRCSKPVEGIADEIFSNRRSQYSSTFPSFSSSPIRLQREQKELRDRRVAQQRTAHRDQNALKARGGSDNIEKFVMESLRRQELQRMSQQAEEHTIPMEEVEELESEQQEDLDDEALIEYIAQRERLEKELDNMLE